MNRRNFNSALAAGALAAVSPFGIVRAQAQKLKVGVILPRSGYLSFIGQSCQKGADLAPGVIKEMLGVDIELMNADFETNVDTARTRAERLIQEGAHVLVGPFDSGAAAAIALAAPESKGPTSTLAPSWMRRSARVRAVSTLVSKSAFISSTSTPSSSLITPGARSAPFWHDCPIRPCGPERGRITPILSLAGCARASRSGASEEATPIASAALNVRRLTPLDLALSLIHI